MKPFYRYLGGKRTDLKYFKDLIPSFKTYIEPFFGGGAVYWHLHPNSDATFIINDNDVLLMKFLQAVADTPEIFNTVVKYWPCTKETFLDIRDNWQYSGDIAEVQRYFYFLRTSFNGYLRYNQKKEKYNMSFGNKKVIAPIPSEVSDCLRKTKIYAVDYKEILNFDMTPDTFVFLDPPYDGLFKYLLDSSDKSSTVEILKYLRIFIEKTSAKVLLTINSTPLTNELFEGYIKRRYTRSNSFGAHCSGKNLSMETLVITNY